MQFSLAASRVIAKSSGDYLWLPLSIHLEDTAAVALRLWNEWLSPAIRDNIIWQCGCEETALALVRFLALTHDLGKATPMFHAKILMGWTGDARDAIEELSRFAGLEARPDKDYHLATRLRHALVSEALLLRAGCPDGVASVVGAHHGRPADANWLMKARDGLVEAEIGGEPWTTVQQELLRKAMADCGLTDLKSLPVLTQPVEMLLTGLLIMADWIASDADPAHNDRSLFPYIPFEEVRSSLSSPERADRAFRLLQLPTPWEADIRWQAVPETLFQQRFSFPPRSFQSALLQQLKTVKEPGIAVLEVPMGYGKTEAALALAELFAEVAGYDGLYFALPTQATSNGIFPRVHTWATRAGEDELHAIRLVHGASQFNDEYTQLVRFGRGCHQVDMGEESLGVHTWFEGRKKALLADFVVGTIDQLLMMALKQKHVMLRHLGLAGKVVIIDEIHAYDVYMSAYLEIVLRWLGAYRVPVIVLSATLPAEKRSMLLDAYRNLPLQGKRRAPVDPLAGLATLLPEKPTEPWRNSCAYPLLTYSEGQAVHQVHLPDQSTPHRVSFRPLPLNRLTEHLKEILRDGGCAGIIVNTVKAAQEQAAMLREHFGDDVMLLHSRFLIPDRIHKEERLLRLLGANGERPNRLIVVGTQVIEQSLDVDFDILYTQLCPIDLLLQRLGREHRHARMRPPLLREAQCCLLGWDEGADRGSRSVYGDYLLMRTRAFLPTSVMLPTDIPTLVQQVYGDALCPDVPVEYERVKKEWDDLITRKASKASVFRLAAPVTSIPIGKKFVPKAELTLSHLLDASADEGEQQAEASVRDSDESFEVLVLQRRNERLCFLPWLEGGQALPAPPLNSETAQRVSRQRLRMPAELCRPWIIRDTIAELETQTARYVPDWERSPWLRGELLLLLDESLSASVGGYRLHYDLDNGLQSIKEGDHGGETV